MIEEVSLKNLLVDELKLISLGKSILEIEAQAILALAERLDIQFVKACRCLLACTGRIVVTGMGKSGHIAKKIAATLASTGSPAFFLHPGEASHGDLGMITKQDVILALSYSGESQEILTILPLIKRLSVPTIMMTGNSKSNLAKFADIHLDVSIQKEACPLGLAPTTSTTVALAMGDALALSLLDARGFTAEDFAQSHPSGQLGRRLLLKIDDIMRTHDAIPRVTEHALLKDALLEMTEKRLGFTTIVSSTDRNQILGVFTDGDLRRTIEKDVDIHKRSITEFMTRSFRSIKTGTLAIDAIRLMEGKTFVLPVMNLDGKLVGALNMHDLLQAQVL